MSDAEQAEQPEQPDSQLVYHSSGLPQGPMLYPRLMHKVAAVIEALQALEEPDPSNVEGTYYTPWFPKGTEIPIRQGEEDDLVGWIVGIDHMTYVFVPYDDPKYRRPTAEDGS